MIVKTYTAAVNGLNVTTVTIEVSITRGIMYHFTGLGDRAVLEGRSRINAALQHIGYQFPKGDITVNMAPADIKKEGSAFDLPLAIALLAANNSIVALGLEDYIILGELSLDGRLQPIRGALPMAVKAKEENFRAIILPEDNAIEAGVVEGIDVYGMQTLKEVIDFVEQKSHPQPCKTDVEALFAAQPQTSTVDFSQVRGQAAVRRAMEVAAAGGHNIIMIGPPGSGKSMIARRLPTILPPLTLAESLSTTAIHSVAGQLRRGVALITERPFRAPHHTISEVALVGGGSSPMPGEISLAHNGVLFLDELPEFNRSTLEVLRQPLEERMMHVSRAKYNIDYPCSFMFVASMNPCPCGYHGDPTHECSCTPGQRQRYMNKISGPLMDRIDLHVEVAAVPYEALSTAAEGESSADIRARVITARQRQAERFGGVEGVHCNAQMSEKMLDEFVYLDEECQTLLRRAMDRMHLSARAYHRILKVARTIADLAGADDIRAPHLAEAVSYRKLDRADWAES